MRRTERRRSRAGQIASARGAQAALAERPPHGTAGRRGRLARPTHAAHAAASSAALAGRRSVRVAAVSAGSGPVRALRRRADRHTAAALQPELRPAQRGKWGRMSRGRSRREARAARQQQKSQIKSGQLKSSQLNVRDHTCTMSACGPATRPRRGGASRQSHRARSAQVPDTRLTVARPAPVTCASARRTLRPAPAARRPPRPAKDGTLRRRCSGAVTCACAANGAE